jgi:catechol-2,3-dioxygenase
MGEHIVAKLLGDFERGKMTRRQLIQSLALAATAASAGGAVPGVLSAAAAPTAAAGSAAPAEGLAAPATYINHISYQVADYTKTRDFYSGLFGMKVTNDDGKQCRLVFGNNILIARNRPAGSNATKVDHVAYSLANWDADKSVRTTVQAELKRRGLEIRETMGSFHVSDPDGFEVQMGGKDQ